MAVPPASFDDDLANFRRKLDERNAAAAIAVSQRDGLMAMVRRIINEVNQLTGTLNVLGVGRDQSNQLHADLHAVKSLILSLRTSDGFVSL